MAESTRKRERSDIRIDAVFDIETQDWTKFVCGGVYYADGTYEAYDYKREEDYFDALMKVRGPNGTMGNVWSHNGGRFDIKWALDWAIQRRISCSAVSAGSNIICATIGDVRFLDSKALTKISLDELTKGASVAKEKLGLECVGRGNGCQEEPGECRGYCSIRRDMPRKLLRRLHEYLRADCVSLYTALQRIREYAAENDLDLGMSVGSSAWKNARRLLELPRAKLCVSDHMFSRAAYFGGRVQIFRPWALRGYEYDVNSMYPSRLAYKALPIGPPRRVMAKDAGRAFGRFPGFYRASVYVPPMHVPPLPVRIGNRICYPTGRITGTWAAPELAYAMERGAKVREFEEALIFPFEKVIFRPWVDRLFALRSAAIGWDGKPDKKGPLGIWLKYYLNSLTGKFGSRPDTERVVIAPSIEEIEEHACVCPAWMLDNGKCRCGAWQQLDDAGNIYAEPRFRIQPCGHIEWAAYLTAEARVEWQRQATAINDGLDLCYGDTDSVFVTGPRTENIGPELGKWELSSEWENFEAFAPKVYRVETAKGLKVKAKGMRLPKAPEAAELAIRSGVAMGKSAVIGFRAGARRGKFFAADTATRRVNVGYGDRILDGQVTRAPTYREALARWGTRQKT
jgi:hypothetical protein